MRLHGAAAVSLLASWAPLGCGDDGPDAPALAAETQVEAPAPEPEPEPEPELDVQGEPRYGAIPLAPGFTPDPREQQGTTTGVVAAEALGEDCTGFISEAALHVVEARGPFARMHLMAIGEAPVGLVLRSAAGEVTCTPIPGPDDEPAMVVTHLAPGAHRVWLATAEPEDSVRYVLGLSEVELSADALPHP